MAHRLVRAGRRMEAPLTHRTFPPQTPPRAAGWTYDDLPELPDDGRRDEIIDGDLFVSPSPGRAHQFTVGRLYLLLDRRLAEPGIASHRSGWRHST